MSLKYEPASEPLHIYVEWLFLKAAPDCKIAAHQPAAYAVKQVGILLLLYYSQA